MKELVSNENSLHRNLECLKVFGAELMQMVDIFSLEKYSAAIEFFVNSIAYLAYVSLFTAFNSTIGRLALFGFFANNIYQGEYDLALWNLASIFLPLIELGIIFMALVSLYRAGMYLYDNVPFVKHICTSILASISQSNASNENGSQSQISLTLLRLVSGALEFLKKDFNDKRACVVLIGSRAYGLFQRKESSEQTSNATTLTT